MRSVGSGDRHCKRRVYLRYRLTSARFYAQSLQCRLARDHSRSRL